jgi:hypothetical protein
MGAVHYLLGEEMARLTPETFTAFCLEHEDVLRELLETRLVQTNAVPRSLALRLGMVEVAKHVDGPVHLVDVGASAGIHLRFDRFGYRLGRRSFGDASSPVQIEAELRGQLPDLDAIPPVAAAVGVDLAPVDVTDPDARRWLEALVWPGNEREESLLQAALGVVAADPPTLVAGDAIDVLPELRVPRPRVVFTAATRMHVPAERRERFDAAVGAFADFWISLEKPVGDDAGIYVRLPSGEEVLAAVAGPRVQWVAPRA